jgi:hypothetical protein
MTPPNGDGATGELLPASRQGECSLGGIAEPVTAVASGVLRFGDLAVDCFVLADGRRVLSKRGANRVFRGGAKDGDFGRLVTRIVSAYDELAVSPNIELRLPGGGLAHAVEATAVVDLAHAILEAYVDGRLRASQLTLVKRAQLVARAVGKVGIVALVDEASGYQTVRVSDGLRHLLDRLLRREPAPWEATFPSSLAQALAALHGKPWSGRGPYPAFLREDFGFIYATVFGGEVARELRRRNPNPKYGRNHHQVLQSDAKAILQQDLRIGELLARQSGSPAEWRARMRAHYLREPLRLPAPTHAEAS